MSSHISSAGSSACNADSGTQGPLHDNAAHHNAETSPILSIIIPAYNEEQVIGTTVRKISDLKLLRTEILVVDDGSSDKTAEQARQAGATVISHPYNIGNGAAVKTAIRSARGSVLVFLDGDGQHDPNDIPKLLEPISSYHMIVGARQRDSEAHMHRFAANKFYNLFASFISGFKVQDLTSGFRAIRREDALRFCDILPNGFSYPTTITLAFIRSGRSLLYVPVHTRYRIGTSKIRLLNDGFEFLIIILKIAMSFSPLRVFIPISSFLFFLGLLRYIYTYVTASQFTNMSHLLINSAMIVFLLGLVAEQIASLRLEKGDHRYAGSGSRVFEEVAALGRDIKPL